MPVKKVLLLLLLVCCKSTLHAQDFYDYLDKKYPTNETFKRYPIVHTEYEAGINIANQDVKESGLYKSGFYQGLTVRGAFESNGRSIYDQLWRYPTFGGGYMAAIFPNPLILGAPNAAFLYMDVPIEKDHLKRKSYSSYALGGGLSFNFRPQNTDLNPANQVIGSYSNVYINFDYFRHFRLNDAFNGVVGVSFTHFSNGASNLPNLGMNMAGVRAGISHNIIEKPNVEMTQEVEEWKPRHMLYFYQAAGQKALSVDGPLYFNTTTSIGYKYWRTYKSRWIGTLDFFYDEGTNSGEHYYSIIPEDKRNDKSNAYTAALAISHEAIYKKWSLEAGAGAYVYRHFKARPPIYFRLGARYRLYEGLYAGVAIKARYFSSDYIEWGLGYNLDLKPKKQ